MGGMTQRDGVYVAHAKSCTSSLFFLLPNSCSHAFQTHTQHTIHNTQHTAHSTQYTTHSTQHTAHNTHRFRNSLCDVDARSKTVDAHSCSVGHNVGSTFTAFPAPNKSTQANKQRISQRISQHVNKSCQPTLIHTE